MKVFRLLSIMLALALLLEYANIERMQAENARLRMEIAARDQAITDRDQMIADREHDINYGKCIGLSVKNHDLMTVFDVFEENSK